MQASAIQSATHEFYTRYDLLLYDSRIQCICIYSTHKIYAQFSCFNVIRDGYELSILPISTSDPFKVLLQWNSTSVLYQLYILNIPSWVSFGHFYVSFHKCLSGMPYILRKNISKFVFENSWFQIADAFQSLLCDGRFAGVVNKSRRCWATMVISSLFLWNQQKTCNG